MTFILGYDLHHEPGDITHPDPDPKPDPDPNPSAVMVMVTHRQEAFEITLSRWGCVMAKWRWAPSGKDVRGAHFDPNIVEMAVCGSGMGRDAPIMSEMEGAGG